MFENNEVSSKDTQVNAMDSFVNALNSGEKILDWLEIMRAERPDQFDSAFLHAAHEELKRRFMLAEAYHTIHLACETDYRYTFHFADYVSTQYHSEAKVAVEKLLALLPVISPDRDQYTANILIARCYKLLRDFDNAIKYYKAAMKINENCVFSEKGIEECIIDRYLTKEKASFSPRVGTRGVETSGISDLLSRSGADTTDNAIAENRSNWHLSLDVSFFPRTMLASDDYQRVISNIARPSAPSIPLFNKQSRLIALGSCFAANFRKWLQSHGYSTAGVPFPEQITNTLAVRHFIEWSLTGRLPSGSVDYQSTKDKIISPFSSGADDKKYGDLFKSSDGLIITYGVAEVWQDILSGETFWHGVPKAIYDKQRHHPVLTTPEWNANNITATIELIREHVGDIPIILTLSPIPLNATFRHPSIWEADCVSKSTLRVAIENVRAKNIPNVYYWPSFEMVRWAGSHLSYNIFSDRKDEENRLNDKGSADSLHVRHSAIKSITDHFAELYFSRD